MAAEIELIRILFKSITFTLKVRRFCYGPRCHLLEEQKAKIAYHQNGI